MKATGLNFTLSSFPSELGASITTGEDDFSRSISTFSSEKTRSCTSFWPCSPVKTSFYMLLVVCFHFLWIFGGFSPTELVRKATGLVWHRFLQNLGSKKTIFKSRPTSFSPRKSRLWEEHNRENNGNWKYGRFRTFWAPKLPQRIKTRVSTTKTRCPMS